HRRARSPRILELSQRALSRAPHEAESAGARPSDKTDGAASKSHSAADPDPGQRDGSGLGRSRCEEALLMANAQDLVKQVKSQIVEVTVDDVKRTLARGDNGSGAVVVDVREREEWVEGYLPGAKWIPRGFLELRIEDQVPDKERKVVVYCAGGTRS